MAQKKLLSLVEVNYMEKRLFGKALILLLILLVVPLENYADIPAFKPTKEDKAWTNEVVMRSLQVTLSTIKEKYKELQKILGKPNHDSLRQIGDLEAGIPDLNKPVLRVFVSSSMGKGALRQYVDEAKKYKAVLVFNGLPEGSWLKLSDLVMSISDEFDNVAMQIDDEAFRRFDVKSVPSFVLSEEEGWEIEQSERLAKDKVSGNIGIKAALEIFAGEGDMAAEAERMLRAGGRRR